jgi:hypothetical protein
LTRAAIAWSVALASACASGGNVHLPGSVAPRPEVTDKVPPMSILWSATRRLTWADFQGSPQMTSEAAAITAYAITYEATCDGSSLSARIVSAFLPEQSWVKPALLVRSPQSDNALNHEQTHFDLSEVSVRRMRKKLKDLDNPCRRPPDDLYALVDPIISEDGEAQRRYDLESSHGRDAAGQAKWDATVARDLRALARYAWDFR